MPRKALSVHKSLRFKLDFDLGSARRALHLEIAGLLTYRASRCNMTTPAIAKAPPALSFRQSRQASTSGCGPRVLHCNAVPADSGCKSRFFIARSFSRRPRSERADRRLRRPSYPLGAWSHAPTPVFAPAKYWRFLVGEAGFIPGHLLVAKYILDSILNSIV